MQSDAEEKDLDSPLIILIEVGLFVSAVLIGVALLSLI